MFARTERLLLRPGWAEDALALTQAIGDEAIVRNLARVPWPYTLADASRFLARQYPPDEMSLLVFRRTQGAPQLIGSAGLERSTAGQLEIGYWLSRQHWGLGYATEAVAALIDLARDSLCLKQLAASHFLDNPASGRVLEKVGFQPTGVVESRYSEGRKAHALSRLYSLGLDAAESRFPKDCPDPNYRMLAA